MTRTWDWVVVSIMGVAFGGFIGFLIGVATSRATDSVFAIDDGLRGVIIGGAAGLVLGLCVGYVLWRTRPGR